MATETKQDRDSNAPKDCTLVLFGASGDLVKRMVMPAIFRLVHRGLLPTEFRLIGYGRTEMTDEEFRERMRKAVIPRAAAALDKSWTGFAARLSYLSGEYNGDDLQGYAELARRLEKFGEETRAGNRRLFYLATPPSLFAPIINNLSKTKLGGLSYRPSPGGWARIVIEKPFGHDLASARALNAEIALSFDEHNIYRIDHFLGKEIVQNLFALRFANGIFEPVWNRNYVDHVQITAAETLGVEGRGGYYESAGALRDMVQNHLLQILALIAIEPPAEWNSRAVRDEKVKVLRAIRKIDPKNIGRDAVRGQYAAGSSGGKRVPAYPDEKKVAAASEVETFAALKLEIDNVRWAGVPFYLRSGKRLSMRATEIVVEFKPAPHTPWVAAGNSAAPNLLVINVSPEEGISIRVEAKRPGQEMELQSIDLDYCGSHERGLAESPSAYEHLLLDIMRGDPTFFARADEVEAAWGVVEPVIKKWKSKKSTELCSYAAGSDGPEAAVELLARDGRRWFGEIDEAKCK
ncbi:MAG: glucose-6-phosphate dehydrogenase [Pyrinomonadaceae bacterium]